MIIPELSDSALEQITSKAERRLYRLLSDALPDDYLVIFQASWILAKQNDSACDGEIDFLVCHPQKGFITIEVKGGGIELDAETNTWTSIDFQNTVHNIKDPVKQALNAKYAVSRKLKEQQKSQPDYFSKSIKGHGVFFPDIKSASSFLKADLPREIIGTSQNLADVRSWIDAVFQFWAKDEYSGPGTAGIAKIQDVFAKSFKFKPLISGFISENEENLRQLTYRQMELLQFISHHRRVTIRGGAGTGKTVLAVEKAKQLAADGYKTLLTCYNRPLADFLASNLSTVENLTVLSVHQLASRYVSAVKSSIGKDLEAEMRSKYPGQDSWNVHLPLALWYAAEIVQTRFDAIVCDEAQDIPEDFWMPLQNLLADFNESPFYVFRDDNQDIYSRDNSDIFTKAPFQLTQNCRNSSEIHDFAYAYYKGPLVNAMSTSGIPVTHLIANNIDEQRDIIIAQVRKSLNDPGLKANQIVVLISSKYNTQQMKDALSNSSISKSINWTANHVRRENEILIETVKRFKGLESPIVILWLDDQTENDLITEEIYVGSSRARSQLAVVSTLNH